MKYPIYSYRDVKVGFGTPVCDVNDQSAIRGFSYAINSGNGVMSFAPKDYDLYKIGEFDTDLGIVKAFNVPELVVSGIGVFDER